MGALYKDDVKNIYLSIPSLPEQHKIAEILTMWDEAIANTESLIAAMRKRKNGLTQCLLFGQVRFAVFERSKVRQHTRYGVLPADWEYVTIESIAHQVSTKNEDGNDLPVLSCTKYDGLVDSLAYFGRQVFSDNTSTYKIVKRGQFAYATNHIEEGSIGYQDLYDRALISPMYTVFETNNKVDDGYLFKLLKTELYRHVFEANTSASIDRRGSLRWNVFSQIKIPLPILKEQRAIAKVMDACEREISITKQKLEALQEQKKGLMERLLTGQIRVKV
jgi:type I restriction enzyme, S subunit